jgi:hypothetical protein
MFPVTRSGIGGGAKALAKSMQTNESMQTKLFWDDNGWLPKHALKINTKLLYKLEAQLGGIQLAT